MDQQTGDSDSFSVSGESPHPYFISHDLKAGLQAVGNFMRPADIAGYTWDECLKLYNTANENRERVLSAASLAMGFTPHRNPLTFEVRNAKGELKQLILEHNCRTNTGGTWQSILMGGDTNANIAYSNNSGAITYTATTVTPTASPVWTTNQWAGHLVFATSGTGTTPSIVFGVILSNTATALTIDQWYNPTSTSGASAATPGANCSFLIAQGQGPAYWIGLSTSATTEDIGDSTLASEFTANFSTTGRWKGVYAQTTVPSGTGTTNSNSVYTVDAGVLTCTTGVTVTKAGLFNAQNGGIMAFERKLATAATLAINDTLDPRWALTIS